MICVPLVVNCPPNRDKLDMPWQISRLDQLGIGLGAAFAAWVGIAGLLSGGRPVPMAAMGLFVVVAVIAADRVTRIQPHVIPALVAAGPLLATVVNRTSPFGGDVVGYANASGALFFLAACAAIMLGNSVSSTAGKTIAYLLAVTWIFVPWNLGAHAAGLMAALMPLPFVLSFRPDANRRVLLGGAAFSAVGLLCAVGLGSAGYRPSQSATLVGQWLQETVDEVRVILWGQAVDLIRESPISGVGPGNFREHIAADSVPGDLFWAHNEYLQVAAEVGVPGGVLLLALVGWAFARLWSSAGSHWSLPAIIALVGVSLHANVDYIWHYPEIPLTLGLLVGAGSVDPKSLEVRAAPLIGAAARVPVLASVVLWLLLLAPIEALNPTATARNGAAWTLDPSGVQFVAPGMVRSSQAPSEILRRFVASGSFTIELWAASHSVDQDGPARILSVSDGIADRNFTVGQVDELLVFRLRTTETNPNGLPQLEVPSVFSSTDLRHIVVSRDPATIRAYVDGAPRWTGPHVTGSLTNWDETYPLLLGNETSGNRPWIGEVRSVALFDRALSETEVQSRFGRPPSTSAPGEDTGPRPVALYTFEEVRGRAVSDRSGQGIVPDLAIPDRIPAPERSPISAMLDPGGDPLIRLAGHALLFGIWGATLLVVVCRRLPTGHAVGVVVSAGGAIAVTATILRYLGGRSPSPWDMVGATIGCGLALLWIIASRWDPPPDHTTARSE